MQSSYDVHSGNYLISPAAAVAPPEPNTSEEKGLLKKIEWKPGKEQDVPAGKPEEGGRRLIEAGGAGTPLA